MRRDGIGLPPEAMRKLRRGLACWLPVWIAAFVYTAPTHADNLDLDGTDGLNTSTIARRERDVEWLGHKLLGAETVAGQNRSFAKPEGLRAGNFIISPEAGALVIFDDNIFSTDAEKVSDIRTELLPSVQVRSQLPRHVLDMSLDGRIVNFVDNPDQSFANVRGRVEGALHFDHAHTLSATVVSSLDHEERNSPSYPFSARDPVEVFYNKAAVGITRDVGRLYGTISGAVEDRNFFDNTSLDGQPLDLDGRDTLLYSTQLRAGYRISPGFDLVGKIRGLKTFNTGDETGDLDALGYEALAGLAFETNPLLRWRILGGFGVRDYEMASLETLTTSLMEADVAWLPTQRLTIYGMLLRRIDDTGGPDGGSLVQTGATIRADYEIYHNLLLNAGVTYRIDDSSAMLNPETYYSGHIGLEYYLTKNWLFTFTYQHDVRESDSDSRDMSRNRFMVGAKLRF
jgi:hypothetical protein